MKKPRKKGESKAESAVVETLPRVPHPEVEILTFETFFARKVRQGVLRPGQHDEVAAFMRTHRLRDKEDSNAYEAILKLY